MAGKLIGVIHQRTTSTSFSVYDNGRPIEVYSVHLTHIALHPGWFELDADEIIDSIQQCMAQVKVDHLDAIGITNQRETVVVWNASGAPLHHAICWCDSRTNDLLPRFTEHEEEWRAITGLGLSTYFTAPKVLWLAENSAVVQDALMSGEAMIGTIDSWIVWKLTGGRSFVTDVTNASRTLLFDIHSLQWSPELCGAFGIPMECLAEVRSNSEVFGSVDESFPFPGTPISGLIGDQQASLVGNGGKVKISYGSGAFLLQATGSEIRSSKQLVTTVAYHFPPDAPVFALEGSVAAAAIAVDWLAGVFGHQDTIWDLAASARTSGGVCFVPAFSGLFCPWWDRSARGIITGLTAYTSREHIARAVIESVAFQCADVREAAGIEVTEIHVDGWLSRSDVLCRFQADILGTKVVRSADREGPSRGAAIAAARGIGADPSVFVDGREDIFIPSMSATDRARHKLMWRRALDRSRNWIREGEDDIDGMPKPEAVDHLLSEIW